MRPPIGPADDGALYAIAVSAQRIAVAGRIRDANGEFAVQFFARPSLHSAGNIAHFPEPIRALRFSPDGKLLAVGMQDGGGVRVLDLDAKTEKLHDSTYGGAVTWMDFGPDDTLAVVADDGMLRLCGAGRSECTPYQLPGGARPWGVAFSPDGARIAVGDRQSPLVHVFDVARAHFGRDFKGASQRQGALGVVAFSRDGQTLFAAGTYKNPASLGGLTARLLRRWTLDGRALGETAVATDTVTDLVATNSGVMFTTAEPAIGRLDDAGRLVALRRSRHIDFRNAGQTSFRVSHDGTLIEMPARTSGAAQAAGRSSASVVFDVIGRRLVPTGTVAAPLANPVASAAGVAVTEWLNNHAPRVNGQLVLLEPPELAHAAAVAPDGSGVAIGTNFFVRYVVPGGERWKAVTNAPAWAVNVSGDGRLVVAGLGDGTVHWYRAADGRELLALFADPETGRWVLSTPEGYFDHDRRADGQPDGRTLVGYQTAKGGSGPNAFIEIGQLYPRFFRPDLVGLSFRDDAVSRDKINDQHERLGSVPMIVARGLPPRFQLLSVCARAAGEPADSCAPPPGADKPSGVGEALLTTSADTVRIRFRLDRPAGEVGGVIIRRDRAVIAPPVAVESESTHSRTATAEIPLGRGANDISFTPVSPGGDVEASDRGSARMRVDRALVMRGAPRAETADAAAEDAEVPHPVTLHVLSVGVNTYARPALLGILPNAANDGKAFADEMRQPTPPVSSAVDGPPPLLNEQATRANIIAALKDIAAKAQPDDLVIIFLAGHGTAVDGRYYFAPYDLGTHDRDLYHAAVAAKDAATHDKAFDQMFRKEGLSQDDILPLISSMKASHVAILLDTCYSASLATPDAVVRRDEENDTMTGALAHAVGRFVLSGAIAEASDDDQPATNNGDHAATDDGSNRDGNGKGHGLFSSFVLRGLAGDADTAHTGRIDIYNLEKYTKAHVEDASGNTQHPKFYFGGNDFFDLRATSTK